MINCIYNSMEVAELVHSPRGTKAVFITGTQEQANNIGMKLGLSARRYNTGIKYKTSILVTNGERKTQTLVLATITKAGRKLKKRGRKR